MTKNELIDKLNNLTGAIEDLFFTMNGIIRNRKDIEQLLRDLPDNASDIEDNEPENDR